MNTTLKHKKIKPRILIKVGLYILAVISVFGLTKFVGYIPSIKEAIVLATSVKPEAFTELYFENHNDLPKSITSGEKYNFTFSIHNLEDKDVEYSYIVYLQTEDIKVTLDENKIIVRNNELQSINEELGPLKKSKMKIVVELINRNQQIYFWLDNQ